MIIFPDVGSPYVRERLSHEGRYSSPRHHGPWTNSKVASILSTCHAELCIFLQVHLEEVPLLLRILDHTRLEDKNDLVLHQLILTLLVLGEMQHTALPKVSSSQVSTSRAHPRIPGIVHLCTEPKIAFLASNCLSTHCCSFYFLLYFQQLVSHTAIYESKKNILIVEFI